MAFNNDKAIYLQIADRLSDEILAHVYTDESRIPSVREYAVRLGVNANTAVKAYDQLAYGACERIREARREAFAHGTLPEVFRQMRLLGVSIDDVVRIYHAYEAAGSEKTL